MEDNSNSEDVEVFKRDELIINEWNGGSLLRIMHWNVLADCLAFGFPKVEEKYLEKGYRIPRIVKEVEECQIEKDGEKRLPDFIWWQEMDMEEEIIERIRLTKGDEMKNNIYDFEKIEKKGGHNDALCIF